MFFLWLVLWLVLRNKILTKDNLRKKKLTRFRVFS